MLLGFFYVIYTEQANPKDKSKIRGNQETKERETTRNDYFVAVGVFL